MARREGSRYGLLALGSGICLNQRLRAGGTLFLFHRKQVRFFRKDGHSWRKKPDGKTVRETHEKLKVDNQDVLNCYYAHAEEPDGECQLQRRCYWLLEGDTNIVLVHYLKIAAEALRSRTERAEEISHIDMASDDAILAMNRLRMDGVNCSQVAGQMDPANVASWQQSNHNHLQGVPGSLCNQSRETAVMPGYGEIEPTMLNQMEQYGTWPGPTAQPGSHPGHRPMYMSNAQNASLGQSGITRGTGNWHQAHAMVHQAHAQHAHAQAQAHQAQAQAHVQAQAHAQGRIDMGYAYGLQHYPDSSRNPAAMNMHAQNLDAAHSAAAGYGPPHNYAMSHMRSAGMAREWQGLMSNDFPALSMQSGNPPRFTPESDNGTFSLWQRDQSGQQHGLRSQSQVQGASLQTRPPQQAIRSDQQQQQSLGYFDQRNAHPCSPMYSSENPSLRTGGSDSGRESPISAQHSARPVSASQNPQLMKVNAYRKSEISSSHCNAFFHIGDFSPDWDYTTGGGKILVTGSLENLEACASLWIMFGNIQVSAEHLQPGVLRCQTPPNPPGSVPMCVTRGDGQPCSISVTFHYNLPIKDPPSNLISSITTETSNRELQVRLVTRLLKETGGSLTGDESETQANMGVEDHRKLVDSAMSRVCALEAEHAERVLELLLERELKIFTQQVIESHNAQKSTEDLINKVDADGMGLLHIVSALGYRWAAELLLASGARGDLRDPWGLTPLHWSAAKGHEDVIALLLQSGVSCHALSYPVGTVGGFTPADLASMHGHNGIAAYLSETHLAQMVARISGIDISDESYSTFRKRTRNGTSEISADSAPEADQEAQNISNAAREAAERIYLASGNREASEEAIRKEIQAGISQGEDGVHDQCSSAVGWPPSSISESRNRDDQSGPSMQPIMQDDGKARISDSAPDLYQAMNRVDAIVHNRYAREQYVRMRQAAERSQVSDSYSE